MIVPSMTKEEVLKEINFEERYYFQPMIKGWMTKYKKQFSRKTDSHFFLGISNYITPKHNRVRVFFFKETYTNGCSDLIYVTLYEMGKVIVYPCLTRGSSFTDNLILFTYHCQQRMFDRTGKTFWEIFKQEIMLGHCGMYINYQGEEDGVERYVANVGECFTLGIEHKWGYQMNTAITKEQEGDDQKEVYQKCVDNSIEYHKKVLNYFGNCSLAQNLR